MLSERCFAACQRLMQLQQKSTKSGALGTHTCGTYAYASPYVRSAPAQSPRNSASAPSCTQAQRGAADQYIGASCRLAWQARGAAAATLCSGSCGGTLKATRRLRSGDDTLRWAWAARRLCMHNFRLTLAHRRRFECQPLPQRDQHDSGAQPCPDESPEQPPTSRVPVPLTHSRARPAHAAPCRPLAARVDPRPA